MNEALLHAPRPRRAVDSSHQFYDDGQHDACPLAFSAVLPRSPRSVVGSERPVEGRSLARQMRRNGLPFSFADRASSLPAFSLGTVLPMKKLAAWRDPVYSTRKAAMGWVLGLK
ncbi:hypothetical protein D3C84_806080 [compost metagenome]